MRKQSFLYVLISVFLFIACTNDDITVKFNQTGTLSIKVVDESQVGIGGAKVFISDFDYGITDDSGIYHSDKLLQGYYDCGAIVQVGKVVYNDAKLTYVIAGSDKRVELNPFINVGDIDIRMLSWDTNGPIAGVNIALIDGRYDYNEDASTLIEKAHFIVKTNSEGVAEFKKIPVNKDYYIFAYEGETPWEGYYHYSICAIKGEKISVYLHK